MKQNISVGVCESRHPMPVGTYIFPKTLKSNEITDPILLYEISRNFMSAWKERVDHINLFVTGLTVATIAVINAMLVVGISFTIYHWNSKSKKYFTQEWVESNSKEKD